MRISHPCAAQVLFQIELNDTFFIVENTANTSRQTANVMLLNQIMGNRGKDKPAQAQRNFESVRADWLYFVIRGAVSHSDEKGGLARVYRPGDNLFLSNSTKEGGAPSESFRAVEKADVVVVSPEAYQRAMGRILAHRAIIYPIATCMQVLNRPPNLRSKEDTELLFKHVSCLGKGRQGVGGCRGSGAAPC